MGTGIHFNIGRAITTRRAQQDLKSSRIWSEKTLEQWDNEIAELQGMKETCSSARFVQNSARRAVPLRPRLRLHKREWSNTSMRIECATIFLSPFQGSAPSHSIPGGSLRFTPGYILSAPAGRKPKRGSHTIGIALLRRREALRMRDRGRG